MSEPGLRVNSNKLRTTFEDLLRERHPQIFILDGTSQLQNIIGDSHYLFLNTIRSLAESSGVVVLLLIGSHDLLEWAERDIHVVRRCHHILFPRYRLEGSDDEAVFRQILFSFEQYLPLSEPPDLVKAWEYIYEKSQGCVGAVKDWLTNALADALLHRESTLSMAYLQNNEPSPDYLLKLFYGIQRFEEFLEKW